MIAHSPQFWLALTRLAPPVYRPKPVHLTRTRHGAPSLGLRDSPRVRCQCMQDHILGFLETGEVMLKNPTKKHFASITRRLRAWGYEVDWKQLERAYFRSCVLSPDRYRAMLRLLSIFAQHLSILSNQLVVRRDKDESANMARARQFIEKHQAEPLSLERVAQAANISRHYFCKIFKKATGVNFIDYLSRVRVEKSKTLLLNPNSRISEAAFASGFQSMTNFNRAFRRIVGRSPSQFRESLPKLRRSGRNGQ